MPTFGIVGSRDYADLESVRRLVRGMAPGTTVISGGARGVDRAATEEAERCGLTVVEYHPDKRRYGSPRCFHERNRQIAAHLAEARGRREVAALYVFSALPISRGSSSTCRFALQLGVWTYWVEVMEHGTLVTQPVRPEMLSPC